MCRGPEEWREPGVGGGAGSTAVLYILAGFSLLCHELDSVICA